MGDHQALQRGIAEVVKRCSAALLRGDIIAFPTETFYGLGVKYDNHASLERLYTIKNRPLDKAMPLMHRTEENSLSLIAESVPPAAERLMDRFWPGPLTLSCRRKPGYRSTLRQAPIGRRTDSRQLICPDLALGPEFRYGNECKYRNIPSR